METSNMSPADFSALMGNNGFGNGNSWWIIILFLFFLGGGNWNRGGDYGQFATAASQQEILFGQRFSNLDNKIDRIGNGIADATFALNNTINGVQTNLGGAINTEGRSLQSQLANCCCENRLAIANLGAKVDQQTAAITQAVHAEGEQTRNLIQTNEIQTLRDKVSALQLAQSQCEQNGYLVSTLRPYPVPTYNAGCGCNCGNV